MKADWKKAYRRARKMEVTRGELQAMAEKLLVARDSKNVSLNFRLMLFKFKRKISFKHILEK